MPQYRDDYLRNIQVLDGADARDADEGIVADEAEATEEAGAENDINTSEGTEPEIEIMADGEYNDIGPKAVDRFVARYIDIFIYLVLLAFFLSIIPGFPEDFYFYYVLLLLTVLLFPFIEAAFLHYKGRMLGKLFIGAKVCYKNGGLLSYSDALNRSFLVMIKGMGLCIPLISIFTYAHNYNKLETLRQEVSWDASLKSVVLHKKLSKVRRGVIYGLFVFIILFEIWTYLDWLFI
ncbi:MAG: RDD family protein [Syntrophomonadaceae bacterium]|jgi:hypothetical protein|nr:RDD family protein [Syntrophomonadaceae bacterium]